MYADGNSEVSKDKTYASRIELRQAKEIQELIQKNNELEQYLLAAQKIIQELYPEAITFPEVRKLISLQKK